MPKVSRETAERVMDIEPAEDRSSDLDDYTVNFVTIKQTQDLTPMLAALPDGKCQCPHWGYVMKGRLTFHFADHDEIYEAGDAFYTPPGHTPAADAGSEFLQFSPADELVATETAIKAGLQAMQAAKA